MFTARHLTLVMGTLFVLFSSSATFADEAFSDSKKAEIGEIVKSYLMMHPELIQDAMNALDQKQKDAEAAAQKSALASLSKDLIKAENGVVLGNPKGDVTLVEFFDYNCGYCKKALTDLQKLIDSDKNLRIIIRDFPVLGPDSVEAAIVAVAARQQLSGVKYLEFHAKLLESKGRIGKDRAFSVAKDLNVDLTKLQKDMDLAETKAILSETMQIGDALRLQGTPAYLIGQEVVFGAVGYQSLKEAIDATRKCGKSQCG